MVKAAAPGLKVIEIDDQVCDVIEICGANVSGTEKQIGVRCWDSATPVGRIVPIVRDGAATRPSIGRGMGV